MRSVSGKKSPRRKLNLPRVPVVAPPTKVRADKRRPTRKTAKQMLQDIALNED